MQLDKDGDLYALPVVVIDITKSLTTAGLGQPATVWSGGGLLGPAALLWTTLHAAPAGLNSYVMGYRVDYGLVNAAAAGLAAATFYDMEGTGLYSHEFMVDVAASIRPSFIHYLGDRAMFYAGGVQVRNIAALTTGCYICAWGYDA